MNTTYSRRQFLSSGSAALIGLAGWPSLPAIKVYHIPLYDAGIQELLTKDPLNALVSLATVGYKELEFSGATNHTYYGLKPAEFRKRLDDSPIEIPIGQLAFKKQHWQETNRDVTDEWKIMLDNALAVGQKYVISPIFGWDTKNPEDLQQGIQAYNLAGEITEKAGLRLGFHPTPAEFSVQHLGQPVYGYMLEHFNPRYVCQQLDFGVVAAAGEDPVQWLRRSPHHFESLHILDYNGGGQTQPALGAGTLPLDDILAFARKNTPIKYWVIKSIEIGEDVPWKAFGHDLQRFRQYGF